LRGGSEEFEEGGSGVEAEMGGDGCETSEGQKEGGRDVSDLRWRGGGREESVLSSLGQLVRFVLRQSPLFLLLVNLWSRGDVYKSQGKVPEVAEAGGERQKRESGKEGREEGELTFSFRAARNKQPQRVRKSSHDHELNGIR